MKKVRVNTAFLSTKVNNKIEKLIIFKGSKRMLYSVNYKNNIGEGNYKGF